MPFHPLWQGLARWICPASQPALALRLSWRRFAFESLRFLGVHGGAGGSWDSLLPISPTALCAMSTVESSSLLDEIRAEVQGDSSWRQFLTGCVLLTMDPGGIFLSTPQGCFLIDVLVIPCLVCVCRPSAVKPSCAPPMVGVPWWAIPGRIEPVRMLPVSFIGLCCIEMCCTLCAAAAFVQVQRAPLTCV